jgi:hypothetical protein
LDTATRYGAATSATLQRRRARECLGLRQYLERLAFFGWFEHGQLRPRFVRSSAGSSTRAAFILRRQAALSDFKTNVERLPRAREGVLLYGEMFIGLSQEKIIPA